MPKTKIAGRLRVKETLAIYLRASWKYKKDCFLVFLLPISNVMLGVILPLFASKILATLATHNSHIWSYFIGFCVTAVIGIIFNMISIRRCLVMQANVMRDLHDDMFARLMSRSTGFYNNQIGGKLVSDAIDFVKCYGNLYNAGFISAFGFALTIVVGLVIVFISNWVIGIALLLLMSGLTWWTKVANERRSRLRNARLVITKDLISHLSDNIVNAVTVKTFAQETAEEQANQKISSKLASIQATDWERTVTSETNRMSALLFTQIVLLVLLITLTRHDPAILGAGIFAFTYTLTLLNRFFTINTLARQIEESFLQASPMTRLLQEPIEITDAPDAKPLVVDRGAIACESVSFHYADANEKDEIFHKLNLQIQPGEKIGLVGHSGGGKSTLTRLLLRFDDISSGSITIDGQDVKTVTQNSLRKQISYVPQEPLLFHRSIRENIAYGSPEATKQAVEEAARLAYAHDFIAKLPQGYDTTVGERGVKLSGGQRQRIAIARAMLKNAPILVLDEATSALDSESEKAIQKALWQLMDDKTAVVIAHRLSTIQKMDRILVLDNGRIVEDGNHKELLAAKGTYARLWAHQSGGFIEE